jgi:hypothetical protein
MAAQACTLAELDQSGKPVSAERTAFLKKLGSTHLICKIRTR